MKYSCFRSLASMVAALLCAAPVFGQFTGEFALPAAGTYSATQTLGQWDLSVVTAAGTLGASSGQVDATGGPGTLVLSAVGGAGEQGIGAGLSVLEFSHVVAGDFTVNFDLNLTGAVSFAVKVDNNPISAMSNSGSNYSYNFDLTQGSTLTLEVSAVGYAGTPDLLLMGPPPAFLPMTFPGTPGITNSGAITLSNFQSAAAIPEPGTWAVILGAVALGVAVGRRGRHRAAAGRSDEVAQAEI